MTALEVERELRETQLEIWKLMLGCRTTLTLMTVRKETVTKLEIRFKDCLVIMSEDFPTYLIATLLPSITIGLRFSPSSVTISCIGDSDR